MLHLQKLNQNTVALTTRTLLVDPLQGRRIKSYGNMSIILPSSDSGSGFFLAFFVGVGAAPLVFLFAVFFWAGAFNDHNNCMMYVHSKIDATRY